MAIALPEGKQSFTTATGAPAVGWKLYTYIAGTSTPKATYTTAAGGTPNTNPVIANSRGEMTIYWTTTTDATLTDENDVVIWGPERLADGAGNLATDLADYATSSKGAGMIGYGSSVVYPANTVGSVISSFAPSIMWANVQSSPYSAVGDGTTDDTVAVQAALDSGLPVWFPPGTYLCDTLTLQANAYLAGAGPGLSIIKQDTTTGASYGTLYCDSGHTSNTKDNITIRDLKITGPSIVTPVFSEFEHLVSLSGVRNVLIDNVHFIGFRGDGLLIGCSPTALTERHNYNVVVRGCMFDGINNENRNGISVIDVDGLDIGSNHFRRCSKSTMPGPIDLEPDNLAAYVIRNVDIHDNTFIDCGGNVASIALAIINTNYTIPQNISIRGNTFKGRVSAKASADIVVQVNRNWVTTDSTMNVDISNNNGRNGYKSVELYGCNGVSVRDNSFTDYTYGAISGYTTASTQQATNVTWDGNTFNRCGSTGLIALAIGETSYADFLNNTFMDSGSSAAGSEHIDFIAGTSNNVRMIGNRYSSPAGQTLISVQKEAGHTFTTAGNVEMNEDLGGLSSFFEAALSDRVVPTLRARLLADQNVSTGSVTTTVIFDTVDEDNLSAYDNSTGEYTVPVAGMYLVTATVLCDYLIPASGATQGGGCVANVLKNGSRRIVGNEWFNGDTTNATISAVSVSGIIPCVATDVLTITLMTFGNTTANNDIVEGASGYGTTFFVRRVGSS